MQYAVAAYLLVWNWQEVRRPRDSVLLATQGFALIPNDLRTETRSKTEASWDVTEAVTSSQLRRSWLSVRDDFRNWLIQVA